MPDEVEVILYVADQARARAFWAAALAREPVLDVPGMSSFAVLPGLRLGLMPAADIAALLGQAIPDPRSADGVPRAELYLLEPDVEVAVERLRAAGGREVSALAMRPWGDRAAYFADPDGHIVAVAERGIRD
jgi:catechol 2,3-dioxygenase-like lactoylglutathione lyase family enzyme